MHVLPEHRYGGGARGEHGGGQGGVVKKPAADEAVVKAFDRFMASGYKRTLFTKDLYLALTRCFGFIAHFDCDGFYEARFGSPAARVDTLTVMGFETFNWSLGTLEQQLRGRVLDRKLVVVAAEQLATETEQRERAELARLKAKYESDDAVDPLS